MLAPLAPYALDLAPTLENAFSDLPADIVDLMVVGAGLAGCSAALAAAERGLSVCVLEAQDIGAGQSGVCGGQFIPAFENDASTLSRRHGFALAAHLLRNTRQALRHLEERLSGEPRPVFAQGGLVLALSEVDQRYLDEESEALRILRVPRVRLGDAIHDHVGSAAFRDGLLMPETRHANPLQVTRLLASHAQAAGAVFHLFTPVQDLQRTAEGEWGASTSRGDVRARRVFLAGGDSLLLASPWWVPTVVVRTWSVATEPLSSQHLKSVLPSNACAYDTRDLTMDYFRVDGSRLLFGGGDSIARCDDRGLDYLSQRLPEVFPSLKGVRLEHGWFGDADVTSSLMPVFRHRDGLWQAGGYSGCGTVNAYAAGQWAVAHMCGHDLGGEPSPWELVARLRHRQFPAIPRFRQLAGGLGAALLRAWST